jgi:RNA polymerase sigma factor (sigma-70 family)
MNLHPLIHDQLARQRQVELAGSTSRRARWAHDNQEEPSDLTALVRAARNGESQAWNVLVGRFTPVMRGVVRGYGLNAADVEDAVQATWTAVFVNIESLREPEAISGWLLVAARRQALRILERSRRELLTDDQDRVDRSTDATPESTLLDHEQKETLSAAVSRLPDRQRAVLDSLNPDISYADISRKLNIPIGSIGPTRERALLRLRRDRRLVALRGSDS